MREAKITWCETADPVTGDVVLTLEDVRRIDREVMNTRGDILFCRCLVLFEGETEEQAVPGFAANYWTHHPNELGVSFVGVGGYGNYLPFLRLASQFRIPWVVLSDGEPKAVQAVDVALAKLGEPLSAANPRVVVLPGGQNFEAYIANASPEYLDVLKSMIVELRSDNDHHRKALQKEWSGCTTIDVIAELQRARTQYGARIPSALAGLSNMQLRVPGKIRAALDLAFPPDTKVKVEVGTQ